MGLGTKLESEADELVEQMNRLLADDSFWTPASRDRAARELNPRVVSIFYDQMELLLRDPWAAREAIIPIPGPTDGFARVLVMGPTGAGKTTLVRQFIGSHPRRDRFPSTSTSRTTVFDTEIVMRAGPYRAAVSFLPIDTVRSYIEECLVQAVSEAAEESSDQKILGRLLQHPDERFRLSYLLGTIRFDGDEESDDDPDDDHEDESESDASEINDEERERMEQRLRGYVGAVRSLAASARQALQDDLEVEPEVLKVDDRDAFADLLEGRLRDDEDAQALVEEILDEVESRFALISEGELAPPRSNWPETWTFTAEDTTEGRATFIRTVNRFSSNWGPNFGRLLTPLVEGLRVVGPFRPDWLDGNEIPPLVLMDGEGLGHTPDSVSVLPTAVTRRYEQSDAILLVDNAAHPMPAAAQAALRSVAASGHVSKLVIAFTHFDAMRKADNLQGDTAKMAFVRASLDNVINSIDDAIGGGVGRLLRRHADENVFFVGSIGETLQAEKRFTRKQISRLILRLSAAAVGEAPISAVPVYDSAYLLVHATAAAREFQDLWNSILLTEHWTRKRALTRRLGYMGRDSYDDLMPVANLIKFLSEQARKFIAEPRAWEQAKPSDELAEAAIQAVAREFFARLHDWVWDRLWITPLHAWQEAYGRSGRGSDAVRSRDVKAIYEVAVPVLGAAPATDATKFLDEVRALFRVAAESAGAHVV